MLKALAAGLAVGLALIGLLGSPPARAADDAEGGSITVSWLPQDQPAQIIPGETSTSRFWVTNTSSRTVDVVIEPATAIPEDNGSLDVEEGADPRFPSTTFVPDHATIAPNETIEVLTTIQAPGDLPPGAYLIPAIVRPVAPPQEGNLQIQTAVVALTTFQLPGDIDARMSAALTLVEVPGTLVRTPPLLPTLVAGDAGNAVLSIRSDSAAGLYAYYEVIADGAGVGQVTFDDAVEGTVDDVRGLPQLYFPGTVRDHDLAWSAAPLTLATTTFSATVSFNPDPQSIATTTADVSFIVVSLWWIVVVLVAVLVLLAVAERRTRRLSRAMRVDPDTREGLRSRRRGGTIAPAPRAGRIVGTVVLGLVAIALAALSDYLVLAALVLVGVALVVVVALLLARSARTGVDMIRVLHAISGLLVVAAIGLLVASMTAQWSPAYAIACAAAACTWMIAAWWLDARATEKWCTPRDLNPEPTD